jgi:hypothetical protein
VALEGSKTANEIQCAHFSYILVTSQPRKVTHITPSYMNNANWKLKNCYQSDTAYSLNQTSAESPLRSPFVPDSWQPVGQFLPHRGESNRAPRREDVNCRSYIPSQRTGKQPRHRQRQSVRLQPARDGQDKRVSCLKQQQIEE